MIKDAILKLAKKEDLTYEMAEVCVPYGSFDKRRNDR